MKNIKKTEKIWSVCNTLYFAVCLALSVFMVVEGYRVLGSLAQQGNVGAAFGSIAVAVAIALGYIASAISVVLLAVSAVFCVLSMKREKTVLKGAGAFAFGIVKVVLCIVFAVSMLNGNWGMLAAVIVTVAAAVLDFICFGAVTKSRKAGEEIKDEEKEPEN